VHRLLISSLVVGGALVWVGCSSPKDHGAPKDPPSAPASEDTIHVGPVSGKLNGEPFALRTARYYIDPRPGFEKVDIQLIDAQTDTPCGPLDPAKPASVWLRKRGTTRVIEETARSTVAQPGPWDVHYQVFEDRWWIGVGEANALVVLSEPGPDLKLRGVLWACFRDAFASCVQGEFEASYCRLSIDEPVRGTAAMERPLPHLMHRDAGFVGAVDGGVLPDAGVP
jgi:hypothetical protein